MGGIKGLHACDRDATLLRSQLEPLSTPMIRTRLEETFRVITDPDTVFREELMTKLLAEYNREGSLYVLNSNKSICNLPHVFK